MPTSGLEESLRAAHNGVAVVAALLATLTYTAVLTTPQEKSDCQTLCSAGNEEVGSPGVITVTPQGGFTPIFVFFLYLNAAGLFLSLSSLTISGGALFVPIFVSLEDNANRIGKAMLKWSAPLLLIAILSTFGAFIVAHFIVFQKSDGYPHGRIVLGIGVMSLLVILFALLSVLCIKQRRVQQGVTPSSKSRSIDVNVTSSGDIVEAGTSIDGKVLPTTLEVSKSLRQRHVDSSVV